MPPTPITEFILTSHAASQLRRRGITEDLIRQVLAHPEQQLAVRVGRVVLQSRLLLPPGPKQYLVRVFADVDRRPAEVVTAYKTSKIVKYWKGDQ